MNPYNNILNHFLQGKSGTISKCGYLVSPAVFAIQFLATKLKHTLDDITHK